jgi:adenylate cyclase
LSEELADVLGKIPELRVIGHASALQFKGKTDDLRSVGTQLGAAHVVEGSVRRSGNRVRVTAQLIRTSDGAHEWSDTYDRSVEDLLQVQTEIGMSLGRALELSVSDLQEEQGVAPPNSEAYDLYLRGLHANDRYTRDGLEEANSYLQRAIDLDSHFVKAYKELGLTHLLQASYEFVPVDAGFARVRGDAERLLKLDPTSGWGQTLLCRFHTFYSWNWAEAQRECAAALARAPRFWGALFGTADLDLVRGEYEESARMFRGILAIDPLNADTDVEMSQPLLRLGRLSEAEGAVRRGLAITPTYAGGHCLSGRCGPGIRVAGTCVPAEGSSAYLCEGRLADA